MTRILARLLLVVASFAIAFTANTLVYELPAHAATIAAPARERAACSAVYHFHHVNATPALYADEALWQAAWHHAWHEANFADPQMRTDIHHWLFTDHGWSAVAYDCQPHA